MRSVWGNRFTVDSEICTSCGECVSDCPVNILVLGEKTVLVDAGREKDCIGCQHCLAVCPTGAVSVLGLQASESLELEGNLASYRQMEHLIKGRRSVRRYLDENIDPALIREILETAWHAPSGRNARQVQFNVVDDRQVMDEIRNRTMNLLAELVRSEPLPPGFTFFKGIVDAWQAQRTDIIFRGAPHLLLTSVAHRSGSPVEDAIIALCYFELACQSAGIGTLWNGMVKMTMRLVPELRAMLSVPADHQLGFAMSFGKPAMNYVRTVQYQRPRINRVNLPEG